MPQKLITKFPFHSYNKFINKNKQFTLESEKRNIFKLGLGMMINNCLMLFLCLLTVSGENETNFTFAKTFKFGSASAAYQVEGAWDLDGKTPSIWDTMTHDRPELIADHSTGDIGPDSYHFYKEDVKALKSVGVSIQCYEHLL